MSVSRQRQDSGLPGGRQAVLLHGESHGAAGDPPGRRVIVLEGYMVGRLSTVQCFSCLQHKLLLAGESRFSLYGIRHIFLLLSLFSFTSCCLGHSDDTEAELRVGLGCRPCSSTVRHARMAWG